MYRYPTHQKLAIGALVFWIAFLVVFSLVFFPYFPIGFLVCGLIAYLVFLEIDDIEGKYPINMWAWKEEKTRLKKCLLGGPLALIALLIAYNVAKRENQKNESYLS